MHWLCSFAERQILPQHWNVEISQCLDNIPVIPALHPEPMPRFTPEGADMPPMFGNIILPFAQAFIAVELNLIEPIRLAILERSGTARSSD